MNIALPSFEVSTAGRIVFGAGRRSELAAATRTFGRRALVVVGSNPERTASLHRTLPDAVVLSVAGEPTVDIAHSGALLARSEGCDVVVAIGGGSAIDAGKAIAALATNGTADPMDYIEVAGRGLPLTTPPLPFLAVPTTAGSGSEVTRNAVLTVPGLGIKASLRSAAMLPRVALVDPELALDLPRAITAATGMDALTQLIEPYVSPRATPFTDALCRDGIGGVSRALLRVCRNGADLEARSEMALASLYGGIALANSGLGAVHGFAAPIGGMFARAAHGAVCAALLPHVTAVNLRALHARMPQSPALERYASIAGDVARWTARLAHELDIPRLSAYGITHAHVEQLCTGAAQASSMKANPIQLTAAELAEALQAAI